jgi:hypothetical protein
MCARHVPCLPRQSAPPPPRHRGKRETSRPEQAAAGSARRTAYGLCSICPPRFVVRLAHGGFGPIVLRHEALSTSLLACWKQAIDRLPLLSCLYCPSCCVASTCVCVCVCVCVCFAVALIALPLQTCATGICRVLAVTHRSHCSFSFFPPIL